MADTHDLQMGVQENKEEKWSMDDNNDEEEEEEIEVSVKQSVVVDPKLQDPKEKKLPASTEESLYFFTSSSSKPRPALDWIWGKKDVKVSNDKQQFSVTVEGKKQEPFAEVYFTTAYSRYV
ncbi:hypothetical protein O6H91_Y039100 [Diphasiastrum complanatum]|nr:hypothetical protein O6H91_Y039100 [Diphasiastrum complanatum]